jgi:plasmid stabilization system protein ParE
VALDLFISRRAAREIDRVAAWWATNRPAAPGAVRQDLEAALSLLVEQPGIGAEVAGQGSADIRRFHIDRIRYWVYYRVRGQRLEIVSVWHSSRGIGPSI